MQRSSDRGLTVEASQVRNVFFAIAARKTNTSPGLSILKTSALRVAYALDFPDSAHRRLHGDARLLEQEGPIKQRRALDLAGDQRGAPPATVSRDPTAGRAHDRAAPEPAGWPDNFFADPLKPHATCTSQRGDPACGNTGRISRRVFRDLHFRAILRRGRDMLPLT